MKLFSNTTTPLAYFRYVDDTFAAFNNEDDCNNFFTHLNSLHPSLCFTQEKESNSFLPFLDVSVERQNSDFVTSVYRPSTKKDVLPSHHCSNLVYLFVCHCDSRYVGRTSQRLQERIKQHIPKFTISTSRKCLPRRSKANSSPRQFH